MGPKIWLKRLINSVNPKSDLVIELVECPPEDYLSKQIADMDSIDTRHRMYKKVAEYGDKFPTLEHIKAMLKISNDKLPEWIGEIILTLSNYSFINRDVDEKWRESSILFAWECVMVIVDAYKSASSEDQKILFKVLAYQISTVPFLKLGDFFEIKWIICRNWLTVPDNLHLILSIC